MVSKLLNIFRKPIFRNALILYLVQAVAFLTPLITLPYLARQLSPEGLGLVFVSQSFAVWLTIIIEFGFNFSATREISQHRTNTNLVSSVVAGVFGAKLLLTVAAVFFCGIALFIVPHFQSHPDYLLWSLLNAIPQGWSLFWYFQGMERVTKPALADLLSRVAIIVATFIFINTPSDGWKVLAIQSVGGLLSVVVTLFIVYQEVQWRTPTLRMVKSVLRLGSGMFVYRVAVSLYTTANPFILGLFASNTTVGIYAGAERLSYYAVAPLQPIWRVLFPRMSHLVSHDLQKAKVWMQRFTFAMAGLCFMLASGLWIFAPQIVNLVLGAGYESSVPLLRILVFTIPCIAVSGTLGIIWMVSLGLEKPFNQITICVGATNIILAFILIPLFAAKGLALSVLVAEVLVVTLIIFFLFRTNNTFRVD
jgi:polysaccharide transporter, PST family